MEFFKKRKKLSIISIIIIIVVIILLVVLPGEDTKIEFLVIERGDLIQEVGITGKVQPKVEVDLAFEISGKVSKVNVGVGDHVQEGNQLVVLNNQKLYADLRKAQATQRAEELELEEMLLGTREEDIKIKETELEQAKLALSNYYEDTENILTDSYNKADDAINKQIDAFFINDYTSTPDLSFSTSDQSAEFDAEFKRYLSGIALSELKTIKDNLSDEEKEIEQALDDSDEKIKIIESFLSRVGDALNSANLSASTISTYKASLNTARSNVNTALSNIEDHIQDIFSQKVAIQKIQDELNLKLAGSTPQAIAAQEAVIDGAKANVSKIQAQIAETIIRSPVEGVVTKQEAKVGEIVGAQESIVSVISDGSFEIEADIPEADIATVKVDDMAEVTLDAYGDEVIFTAHIVMIDPAETMIEGVASYKTKLYFDNEDARIRPGMTANLDIITARLVNVIAVPRRTVVTKNGQKFVRILEGEIITERDVITGLSGIAGNIEIIEGLNEGDKVVTSVKEE